MFVYVTYGSENYESVLFKGPLQNPHILLDGNRYIEEK